MKSNARSRAFAPIVLGLVGMAAYEVILRLGHPGIMENDFFHGLWFGICLGLEVIGLYRLSRPRGGSAA